MVHLSHPWCDCKLAAGDTANVIGGIRTTDAAGVQHAHLSLNEGLFVLHPDVLLSGRRR
jgi:DNA replication factor Dna2